MALKDLVEQGRTSTITEEDRISHTTKMAERVFGVPVADLGTVEMVDGRAVLVIEHNGQQRRLQWRRSPRAHIQWFADDSDRPLRLSSGATPLASLLQELDD